MGAFPSSSDSPDDQLGAAGGAELRATTPCDGMGLGTAGLARNVRIHDPAALRTVRDGRVRAPVVHVLARVRSAAGRGHGPSRRETPGALSSSRGVPAVRVHDTILRPESAPSTRDWGSGIPLAQSRCGAVNGLTTTLSNPASEHNETARDDAEWRCRPSTP